jgi:hypothetical protein
VRAGRWRRVDRTEDTHHLSANNRCVSQRARAAQIGAREANGSKVVVHAQWLAASGADALQDARVVREFARKTMQGKFWHGLPHQALRGSVTGSMRASHIPATTEAMNTNRFTGPLDTHLKLSVQLVGVQCVCECVCVILDGRNTPLTDGVQRALGRPPRSFSDFVKRTAASGVWGGHGIDRSRMP